MTRPFLRQSEYQYFSYNIFQTPNIPCFAGMFSPFENTCRGAKGFEFGSKFEVVGPEEPEIFSFKPLDQAW